LSSKFSCEKIVKKQNHNTSVLQCRDQKINLQTQLQQIYV
jgi:hypothetical protein